MFLPNRVRAGAGSAQCRGRARRGAIVVMVAVFMIAAMALLALSVDLGYLMMLKTELKRTTDAAALA